MSDVTNKETIPGEPETAATPGIGGLAAQKLRARQVLSTLKRHPLGIVLAVGAAVALVEIELAVGILTGIGATALLATKSGPEARQEVLAKGHEVVAKGKAAIERARVALAHRKAADATPSTDQPTAPPAA